MANEDKIGRTSWPLTITAIALAALAVSGFAFSMLLRESLELRDRIDGLEAELKALHDELEGGAQAGRRVQLEPTLQFTLVAFIDGFIGMGGDINGKENPTLLARPGDVVKVTVVNGEDLEHDFVIDELGVYSRHLSTEGQEDSVLFIVPAQGSFYYYCSVPGHRDYGMEGTLEIAT